MPIPPTMPWDGSGSPAAAPMQPPISASSIRCSRERSSIRAATMCGAGFPNSAACLPNSSIGRGRPGRRCRRRSIPSASSSTPLRAIARSSPSARSRNRPEAFRGSAVMKIAVIGAGVAGLGAAWSLSRHHDVVVYERESRFGGHACTVEGAGPGGAQPVDMGFIVYNERNYPNLVAVFDHLGVPTEESDMSFAVSLDSGRYEYASSYAGYLVQRRNAVRPSFLRMTRDILRFNRLAPQLLSAAEDLNFTICDFIARARLINAFRENYLVPMAHCIWSTPLGRMLDYPAQTFARFFHNHGLLTSGTQLPWRTVSGGSRSYVERL